MEKTVVLLKPDCVQKGLMGEVLKRFEAQGFRVVGCKMMQLDDAILKDHYAHLVELPFFPEILGFMQSSPIMALALEGEGIIQKVRDFIGPTDSTKAEKGTFEATSERTKCAMSYTHPTPVSPLKPN